MNDTTTIQVFKTKNWKGEYGTFGYVGDWCTFSFYFDYTIEDIFVEDYAPGDETFYIVNETSEVFMRPQATTPVSSKRFIWNFGDGETFVGLSQTHSYKKPGMYTVSCKFIGQDGIEYINAFTNNIEIIDYISNQLEITSIDGASSETMILSQKIPFIVKASIPQRNQNLVDDWSEQFKIIPHLDYVLSTESDRKITYSEQEIDTMQWVHLLPTVSFYDQNGFGDKFKTVWNEVFITIDEVTKEPVITTDRSGIFAGLVSTTILYIKNDIWNIDNGVIWVSIEPDYIKDLSESDQVLLQTNSETQQFLNIISNGFQLTDVTPPVYTGYDRVYFTANGFSELYNTKFFEQPFTQVAQLEHGVSQTNYQPSLYESKLNLSSIFIVDANTYIPLSTNYYTISAQTNGTDDILGGNVKFTVNLSQFDGYDEITIRLAYLSGTDAHLSSNTIHTLSTNQYSNPITIKNTAKRVTKINEDFDIQEFLRDIRTQSVLNNKEILYNNFFPELLGDINSDENVISKQIYEKIANFGSNRKNIDTCEINQLKDAMQMLGVKDIGDSTPIPQQLNRLMNILSIKQSILAGQTNQNQENFINKGFVYSADNEEKSFGINKGNLINIQNYYFNPTTDNYIVAYEKFQEKYTLINTNFYNLSTNYQDLSAWNVYNTPGNTYLSGLSTTINDYKDEWGWGLVLPTTFLSSDIPKFYNFYEFCSNDMLSTTLKTESVIDFDNERNQIPLSQFKNETYKNDIIEQMQKLFHDNIFEQ